MTTKNENGSTAKGASNAKESKSAIDLKVNDLTAKINYFKVKNDLLKKKRRFENTQKLLVDALDKIDSSNDFDFETKGEVKFKIIQDYNSDICSINNPFVIAEIIGEVLKKISTKISSIDAEILA